MKPTDEQLRDPVWWDENASREESHYCKRLNGFTPEWDTCDDCVPRPTPLPTEWRGDGLPPVGAECRIVYQGSKSVHTERAKITYHGNGVSCYVNSANGEEYSISHYGYEFQSIQSERDKALAEMWNIMNDKADYGLGGMASALYDAGRRKQMSRAEAQETLMDLDIFLTGAAAEKILDALGFKE